MTALLLRARFVFLLLMLLAIGASALIIITWIVNGDSFGEFWLMATLLLGAYAFVSLLCVNLLCRRRRDVAGWIGLGTALLALIIWHPVGWIEIYMWRAGFNTQSLILAGTMCSAAAVWCGLYAVFRAHTWVNLGGQIAMAITLALAAVFGMMTFIAGASAPRQDAFWAVFGIVGLLGMCGLLATMSLALMSRVRATGTGETISGKVLVDLHCPRCASAQQMRTGLSRCTNCGLRIEIIVEEPVCVCGYQLYQLTGTTCPECGREIPESDRWAVHAEKTTEPGIVFD
jgi:hypothetical protein